MKRTVLLIITVISVLFGGFAAAHTLGIDKAELVELGDGNYRLSSFVPPVLANYISPPELPGHCTFTGSPRGERGIYEVRFLFSCTGPLTSEHEIRLPWNREGIMLTVQWQDQEPLTRFTKRTGAVITVDLTNYLAGSGSFISAAKRYTVLGIEHILVGLDHLLFVAGLVLIVGGLWPLVKTITAFTLAHSLTLALATLGFFNLPSKPVEAAIAPVHRLPGHGDNPRLAGTDQPYASQTMAGGLWVRSAAWTRFCRRTLGNRAASAGNSGGPAVFQYRGGNRSVALRFLYPLE